MEKLDLLEERLNRFIDLFSRLREEKSVLEHSLDEKIGRLNNLENEVGKLRLERDVIQTRLGSLIDLVERLQAIETNGACEEA